MKTVLKWLVTITLFLNWTPNKVSKYLASVAFPWIVLSLKTDFTARDKATGLYKFLLALSQSIWDEASWRLERAFWAVGNLCRIQMAPDQLISPREKFLKKWRWVDLFFSFFLNCLRYNSMVILSLPVLLWPLCGAGFSSDDKDAGCSCSMQAKQCNHCTMVILKASPQFLDHYEGGEPGQQPIKWNLLPVLLERSEAEQAVCYFGCLATADDGRNSAI